MSKAAPMTRTRARAISLMTRMERILPWRKPMPERLEFSLSEAARLGRDAEIAGTRPKTMPVSSEMPKVNSRTRRSSATAEPFSPIRGISPGLMLSSKRTPANPTSKA